jgi:transposase-like protein
MKNSFIQKFFKTILSQKRAADMEAESRAWMLQCPHCKHERSFWEMGGIRWKAAGNPRMYRRCPNCGRPSWMLVYQKAS